MKKSYDAIVVGGGVIGCSIAYNLSKRGYKIVVLEKDRLASKASSAAAGMLAAQAELEEETPLSKLARKSRAMFPTLAEELKQQSGVDIEYLENGMYKVAVTSGDEQRLKQIVQQQQYHDADVVWLTAEQLKESEPALSDHVMGAMYLPNDGQVSAPKLSKAFACAAAKLGVDLKEFTEVHGFIQHHEKVSGVVTNAGEIYADQIIVAGGAWSKQILAELGIELSAYPVKGECFSVKSHRPLLTNTIFTSDCYLVPKVGGRIIVGATEKPHLLHQSVSVGGISKLMEKAKQLVPSIEDTEWEAAWAGIRPQTADELPYLGEHPDWKGLYIATGHYRNGILLSPITGQIIADLIEGKVEQPEFVSPFKIDRNRLNI